MHPQILYEGKTNRCHPAVEFPEGWDVSHTSDHRSNEVPLNCDSSKWDALSYHISSLPWQYLKDSKQLNLRICYVPKYLNGGGSN